MCDLLDEPMPVSARKNSGEGLGLQLGKYYKIVDILYCFGHDLEFYYFFLTRVGRKALPFCTLI